MKTVIDIPRKEYERAKKDLEEENIQIIPNVQFRELIAPIPAGTVLGTASVFIGQQLYTSVNLATADTVELDRNALLKAHVQDLLAKPWIKTLFIAVVGGILILLFAIFRYQTLRHRHLRERLEQEERRALEAQLEASMAESRAAQEDMLRFRESLPLEEKTSSGEKYRVIASDPSVSEPVIGDNLTDFFSNEP